MQSQEILLSVPSKCFLFGEYAVLAEGPALLATFPPEFQLRARAGMGANPFPPASPGGKLWDSDPAFFSKWELSFSDPYSGAGGFGRSSAEFSLLYLLRAKASCAEVSQVETPWRARELFQALTGSDASSPPSGIDVVAQSAGQAEPIVLYVDAKHHVLKKVHSIPRDLRLFLIQSGIKAATHTHLGSLKRAQLSCVPELNAITALVLQLLSGAPGKNFDAREQANAFGEALSNYGIILENAGLASEAARLHMEKLRRIPCVLGAKGCGALGADIYAVATYNSDYQSLLRAVHDLGLGKVFDFRDFQWLEGRQ